MDAFSPTSIWVNTKNQDLLKWQETPQSQARVGTPVTLCMLKDMRCSSRQVRNPLPPNAAQFDVPSCAASARVTPSLTTGSRIITKQRNRRPIVVELYLPHQPEAKALVNRYIRIPAAALQIAWHTLAVSLLEHHLHQLPPHALSLRLGQYRYDVAEIVAARHPPMSLPAPLPEPPSTDSSA